VVRKWSYINSDRYIPYNELITSKFKLKIFRKNTRFKKFNVSYTKFLRKTSILRDRRNGLKPYVIMSSKWVKLYLTFKKLTNLTQNIKTNPYLISHSHPEMLNLKFISQLHALGICKNPINSLKTPITNSFNVFFPKNNKLTNYSQFNSWKNVKKLNTLGFSFGNVRLDNNNYPITTLELSTRPDLHTNLTFGTNSLLVLTSNTSSIKALHTYLILFLLHNKHS
jgi:hypothetical protein